MRSLRSPADAAARSADSRSAPSRYGSTGTPVRLEQVFDQHRDQRGQVHAARRRDSACRCAADGDDAVLSVEDTGVGISPELLPFIFDMYVQAEPTLDRARGGLGIGLTLVRRLVELHGGTVVASSEGEGNGSTFTVRLRKMPSEETTSGAASVSRIAARSQTRAADRGQRRRTRDVADDARARGPRVYDATDGVRGLELLDVVRPDVGDHRHRSSRDGRIPGGQADSREAARPRMLLSR